MWLSAAKNNFFCNFPAQEFECMVCCPIDNVTSCSLCIGYHLDIINIIVETNYEAYYKLKVQNEWGTFIDLKVLPVSYLFLWCPPQCLGDPIRRNGGIHAISCKIRIIRDTLKHGIYRIFCIWFELDWRKSRGNIKNSIFVLPYKPHYRPYDGFESHFFWNLLILSFK